jgi:hypothetical protein
LFGKKKEEVTKQEMANVPKPMSKEELPKSEKDWEKVLSPEEYRILRLKGTEMPGSVCSNSLQEAILLLELPQLLAARVSCRSFGVGDSHGFVFRAGNLQQTQSQRIVCLCWLLRSIIRGSTLFYFLRLLSFPSDSPQILSFLVQDEV